MLVSLQPGVFARTRWLLMSACAEAACCASVVDTYSPLKEYLFRAIGDDDPVGNDRLVRMSAREAEVLDALGRA
jgi:hypothetical protein